jgi:hypothetical protein
MPQTITRTIEGQIIGGTFTNRKNADKAVQALQDLGISTSDIGGVLWNAYIEALRPGFDPNHSPPKPTDTVTTPQTSATEKEAALPSPADKNK